MFNKLNYNTTYDNLTENRRLLESKENSFLLG